MLPSPYPDDFPRGIRAVSHIRSERAFLYHLDNRWNRSLFLMMNYGWVFLLLRNGEIRHSAMFRAKISRHVISRTGKFRWNNKNTILQHPSSSRQTVLIFAKDVDFNKYMLCCCGCQNIQLVVCDRFPQIDKNRQRWRYLYGVTTSATINWRTWRKIQ